MKQFVVILLLGLSIFAPVATQGIDLASRYSEVGKVAVSADQDLGLTVAFKLAVNQAQTAATTPGAYLAERVAQLLADYSTAHVSTEQQARLDDALAKATDKQKQDVAAILGVDLVVTPPADVVVGTIK